MSGRRRRELERLREELASKVAARLIDEPKAEVSQEVARVRYIDVALGALPAPWWRALLGPAVMAFICLAAVWAVWTVTIDALGRRTGVVLSVDAATVNLRTASVWQWSDAIRLADGQARIERAQLTFSDPDRAFSTLPGDAWLDIDAAGLTLQDLGLEPGTQLALEHMEGGPLALYAAGGGAAGSMLVNGATTLKWGETEDAAPETESLHVDVPERITFSVARRQGIPARLVFRPEGPLTLRDLAVSSLRFGREVPKAPGEPVFVSTVRGGHLRIPDVGEAYDLSIGYAVILTGLDGYIRQLQVGDGDAIALNLEGTVERVSIGPQGRERDATPSVLAYLYRNEPLGFLFAAASFVWGALWSLRRLIGA